MSAYIYFKMPRLKKIYYAQTHFDYSNKIIQTNLTKPFFVLSAFNNKNKCLHADISGASALKKNYQINHPFYFLHQPKELEANYKFLVSNAVKELNLPKSKLKKVVLAQAKIIKCSNCDLLDTFKIICNDYDNHFCYLVTDTKLGTYIGATPELLLGSNNKNLLTVALAGTKNNMHKKWTNKERDEQQWVKTHIEESLKNLNISYKPKATKTIKSGNLYHLLTKYHINISSNFIPKLLLKLNPTPAVAGYPVSSSIAYINSCENEQRGFYSGFVGIINGKKPANLYVNLRCAQVFKNKIKLFAGAGITALSIPKKEHSETLKKMDAIGKYFR